MIDEALRDAALILVYGTLASSLAVPVLYTLGVEWAVRAASWLGVALFLAATAILLYLPGVQVFYDGLVIHDEFSKVILAASALGAVIVSVASGSQPERWRSHPAFYGLLPLTLFGLFYLAGAADAVMLLASWLLVSVASYVIVATPDDRDSRAAATRYIYLGSLATIVLVFWIATIHMRDPAFLFLSMAALVASIGFKVGVAPFHWWIPSVYGRADGRVVAVVAGVAKAGFVAFLARFLIGQFFISQLQGLEQGLLWEASLVLALIAVATMTYGNVAALITSDLRVMLAYSSVAHSGYILLGVAVAAHAYTIDPGVARAAMAGVALQVLAYSLAKSALFSMAAHGDVRGMLSSTRAGSISVAVLLASLLGIPILVGFWGKLYIFLATASYSIAILVIALVNSAVSSAYYIRFLREATMPQEGAPRPPREIVAALVLAALATLTLGLASPLIAGYVIG